MNNCNIQLNHSMNNLLILFTQYNQQTMNEKHEVDTLDLMSRPGLIYLQFLIVANQSKCQFSILLANLIQ
jgi:hypothetical protein